MNYIKLSVSVHYAVTLVLVISLVLFIAKLLHIADPTWALISAVICTELDVNKTTGIVIRRVLLTILGVGLALVTLLIGGPSFATLLVGVAIITLICHCIGSLSDHWKFTTATAMVVLVVATQQHSVGSAELVALKRAAEVAAGSVISGLASIISSKLWHWMSKKQRNP